MRRTAIRPRNPERRAREFARSYHSEERVRFVKRGLCCVVPNCLRNPCDNAHIETGGIGYKAHYTLIVPLCSGLAGHHRILHQMGRAAFEALYPPLDLKAEARWTEQQWLARGAEWTERHRRLDMIEEV